MRKKIVDVIILGHKNLGEADKSVYLYCEEFGKIRTIAKGARKITSKFTGHLETLSKKTVSLYFGPKNILITEISEDSSKIRIKGDLKTITSALQVAEITNQMLYENQNLENLSRLIEKTIIHLNQTQKPFLITAAYIVKLLDKVGLMPNFKHESEQREREQGEEYDSDGFDPKKAYQTEPKLEKKYQKLFHYLQKQPFSSIEKISLTKTETKKFRLILQKFIELETNKKSSLLEI